jgi:hypothetical protein
MTTSVITFYICATLLGLCNAQNAVATVPYRPVPMLSCFHYMGKIPASSLRNAVKRLHPALEAPQGVGVGCVVSK